MVDRRKLIQKRPSVCLAFFIAAFFHMHVGRSAKCPAAAPMLRFGIVFIDRAAVNLPVVLVLTTLPDSGAVSSLAHRAIDARLAACVTELGAVTSRYRWEGKVETAQEIQVLFKTSVECADELTRFIRSNHPYETREIVSWQADASRDYGHWINAETVRPINV
jgi:periplasmic divalent cation tolerance protein